MHATFRGWTFPVRQPRSVNILANQSETSKFAFDTDIAFLTLRFCIANRAMRTSLIFDSFHISKPGADQTQHPSKSPHLMVYSHSLDRD